MRVETTCQLEFKFELRHALAAGSVMDKVIDLAGLERLVLEDTVPLVELPSNGAAWQQSMRPHGRAGHGLIHQPHEDKTTFAAEATNSSDSTMFAAEDHRQFQVYIKERFRYT